MGIKTIVIPLVTVSTILFLLLTVLTLYAEECGKSNLNSANVRVRRLVGGRTAQPGNFPWHAGLYVKKYGVWENACGATLVSKNAVITGAHCVTKISLNIPIGFVTPPMDPTEVMVALGKIGKSWNTLEETEIKRGVKQIHVHPNYKGFSQKHGDNIAVLILEEEVPVSKFVMPACLDYQGKHVDQLISDSEGYVAGWGQTEDRVYGECSWGSSCYSPIEELQYARTKVINYLTCFNITQSLEPSPFTVFTPEKLCTQNVSVLQVDDDGGGLTFVFDGLHFVYGVSSIMLRRRNTEDDFHIYGSFINVSNYMEFIKSKLA